MNQTLTWPRVGVVASVLVFLWLSGWTIGIRSFWVDEAAVAQMVSAQWRDIVSQAVVTGHPVLYGLLVKGWSAIFGISEVSLRSFSALFGGLLILTLSVVGREVLKSRGAGALVAFMGATSPFLIWFSTQAKGYTLAAWLGLVSFYYFYQLLRKQSRQVITRYVIFSALAAYAHPWLGLLLLGQLMAGLLVWWQRGGLASKVFVAVGIAAGLSGPACLIYGYQGSLGAGAWIEPVNMNALLASLNFLSYGVGWPYLLLSLFVLGVVLWQVWDEGGIQEKISWELAAILLAYVFWPLLVAWLVSQFKPIYVVGRYEMIVWPGWILLLAYWWLRVKWKTVWVVLVVVLLVMGSKEIMQQREEAVALASTDKSVVMEVTGQAGPEDVIVASGLSWATVWYYASNYRQAGKTEWQVEAFPAEVAKHLGWINQSRIHDNLGLYQAEAKRLVASSNDKKRVWLFSKRDEAGEIILQEFLRQRRVVASIIPAQPRQAAWFDLVLVLERIN